MESRGKYLVETPSPSQLAKKKSITARAKIYKMCLLEARQLATLLDSPTNENIVAIATTLFISVPKEFFDSEILDRTDGETTTD